MKAGDCVKYLKNTALNGGSMNVSKVENGKVLCDYFYGSDLEHRQDWFSIEDLEIIKYGDNSLRKEE